MGIIKIYTMPLLSTLAALIIIVHCIEEDLENEYRHDLRPRILDTGKPALDESWGGRDESSMALRTRRTDDWKQDGPVELLKRRRKRKRRPPIAPIEEAAPQDEITYPDEPVRPYHNVDSEKTLETTEESTIRRRQPDQRPIRWTEDATTMERPHRKRLGIRRKRPPVQTSPERNEFREIADINEAMAEVKIELQDKVRGDSDQAINLENVDSRVETKVEITPNRKLANRLQMKVSTDEVVDFDQVARPQNDEDKSLSEFSIEVINNVDASKPKIKFPRRHKGKTSNVLEEHDKRQEPMEPLTLKDILKKSNGSSLSEILQQHNLSLTDLLHGKERAVSIFKNEESIKDHIETLSEVNNVMTDNQTEMKVELEGQTLVNSESKHVTEPVSELITTDMTHTETITEKEAEPITTNKPSAENNTKIRRRFPITLRKKLRMRPMFNASTTQKSPLNRDLISINTRKYTHLRRNATKSKEWKDIIQNSKQNNTDIVNNNITEIETTTPTVMSEETTIAIELISKKSVNEQRQTQVNTGSKFDNIDMDVTEAMPTLLETTTDISKSITDKPIGIVTMTRPTAISLGLRQTALNNRLKRKRLKQKNSTTEPPQDDILKRLYGMSNLVSSSEFIAKTQPPQTTTKEIKDLTTSDDFTTTDCSTKLDDPLQEEIVPTTITTPKSVIKSTTENSSNIEIDEILNDTQILGKLSRILMERNMTLEELVAHRERGSSRVHLADIFHNTSKESNSPEPFLTKSLLEPMSKETYPLRALLDANSHDPNDKATTDDPKLFKNVNIPVAMDFGNNVNENVENMGIMSLFNKLSKNATKNIISPASKEKDDNLKDIVLSTTTTTTTNNETDRNGRILGEMEDDIVSWNEIFSLMGRPKNNATEEIPLEAPRKKITIEDIDGDGLMLLENLQRLKDLDNHIGSGLHGNIQVNALGNLEPAPHGKGIFDNIPSQTTSITIATVSIVGLAMVLFLLTYVAFKWKQQNSTRRKSPSFCEERISTPVFENRKGHKNNNSTRSISPIIQTSNNIYTVNTADSQNGEESSEYMWDSLRKPFQ